jgi:hypothetical protein
VLLSSQQTTSRRVTYTGETQATFLACIDSHKAGRSLYYLFDYYVELIYDFDNNRVFGVFAFKDPWYLDDWL